MKDIKSLYSTAKTRGRDSDITAYSEAVNELFESNPNDYILQLEYIIMSNIGIKTLKPFIEKYGLPIACYEPVMACLEKCISKCEISGRDSKEYKEAVTWLENFRKDHINCFMMFEFYGVDLPKNYVSTYYSMNENGIQNRKLLSGMVKAFNEAAIPDAIITASSVGKHSSDIARRFIESYKCDDPLFCEFAFNAMKENGMEPVASYKYTASGIIKGMRDRNNNVFREAMIMGDTSAMYEYSDEEISAIRDLITYNEYSLTWMDESADSNSISEKQKEIFSLYEELDGLISEDEDVVEDKKDVEYVPIFGVVKSYSDSELRNDSSEKSEDELKSIKFKHLIKTLTRGDNYSHALVSFNEDLTDMYSFDDAGFVQDSIMADESWLSTDSIYICVMFVSKEEKERMRNFVQDLIDHKNETKYAYANILKAYICRPLKSDKRFVCSTFTSYILQCSNPKNLHRDYSRMRPEDITILPRSFYVMNVKDRLDFLKRKEEMSKRVKEIFSTYHEEIEDYNNYLPKIMLKDQMDRLKTLDKLLDWFINKL